MVQTRSGATATPSKTEPEPGPPNGPGPGDPALMPGAARASKWGDIFCGLALVIQCFYLYVLCKATSDATSSWAKLIGPMVSKQGFCVRNVDTLYSSHFLGFIFAIVACPLLCLIYSLVDKVGFDTWGVRNWYVKDLWQGVFIHGVLHGVIGTISYFPTTRPLLEEGSTLHTLMDGKMTFPVFLATVAFLFVLIGAFLYYLFHTAPGTKAFAAPLACVLSAIHALFIPFCVSFTYVLTALQAGPILCAMFSPAFPIPKDEYYRLFAMISYLGIALAAWVEPFFCQNSEGQDWWYMHYGGHVIFDITVAGTTVVFLHFALPVAMAEND